MKTIEQRKGLVKTSDKLVEPKKQRKKSRWFYSDTARADREEADRLKSDVDYRAFKNQNNF